MRVAHCPLALLTLLAALWSWPLSADRGPVIPPAATGEQCVAPADIMRRDHMDLLNHQRDETVIDGNRSNPFSLIGCVNCHASRDDAGQAVRIDAEGQFCQSCHAFAAVRIDCFTCHAAVPEEGVGLPDTSLPPADDSALLNSELRILQAYARGH
jgi:hypothetical protein